METRIIHGRFRSASHVKGCNLIRGSCLQHGGFIALICVWLFWKGPQGLPRCPSSSLRFVSELRPPYIHLILLQFCVFAVTLSSCGKLRRFDQLKVGAQVFAVPREANLNKVQVSIFNVKVWIKYLLSDVCFVYIWFPLVFLRGKLGNGNNVRTSYAFNDSDGKELSSSGPRNANAAPWVFAQKA